MRLFLYVFSTILIFCSCNSCGDSSVGTGQAFNHQNAKSRLNDTGTRQLLTLIKQYYKLKDALVESDAIQADKAAEKLRNAVVQLENTVNKDSLNTVRLWPDADSIISGIDAITSVKDETTEYKRIPFEKVSDAVYRIILGTELQNAGIYRLYCPMAFNDKGAYWLSSETEIRNPYFGSKMLECGEVTDTL